MSAHGRRIRGSSELFEMYASTKESLLEMFLEHIKKPLVPNNKEDAGGFPPTSKQCRSLVWDFRCTMLEESGSDLNNEWRSMSPLAERNSNLSDYNMWNHILWVVKKLGAEAIVGEFSLTQEILAKDPENCYAGRNMNELAVMLEAGVILCYLQRYFVLKSYGQEMQDPAREREVIYAVRAIIEKPENECSWRYLKELYLHHDYEGGCLEAAFQFVLSSDIVVVAEYIETGIMRECTRHNPSFYMPSLPTKSQNQSFDS